MKRIFKLVVLLFLFQGLFAQEIKKDSLLIAAKSCYRKRTKITITVENRTGIELQRVNPMAPMQLFKWSGSEWVQLTQVGYCACGMNPCPPPPELIPFYANDKISLDWDQRESRCIDKEKGLIEYQWSGKGKYKIIFEFKKDRYGESIRVEKEFRIR